MNRCKRCNRSLKNPPSEHGMGPSCERAMFGAKPPAVHVERHVTPDERQGELWPGLWQRIKGWFERRAI